MCMLISANIFAVYAIRWQCKNASCIYMPSLSVHICEYLSISGHICVYHICLYTCICVCMCALTVHIPNQGAYGPHWSLCGLGASPCGQRCRLLAVHNWYVLYEQIWARYVYVERYRQIQTDLNAFKRPKMVSFLGKWSIWGLNTCISGAYLVYIRVYHVNICLYVYIVPS